MMMPPVPHHRQRGLVDFDQPLQQVPHQPSLHPPVVVVEGVAEVELVVLEYRDHAHPVFEMRDLTKLQVVVLLELGAVEEESLLW